MHYFLFTWKFKILFLLTCAAFPLTALVVSAAAAIYYASLSAGLYSLYCSRLGVLDTVKLNLQEIFKGVYPAYFNKISFLLDISDRSKSYETISFIFLTYCMIAALIYIFYYSKSFAGLSNHVILVSTVFLAAGLFAPVLAIKASGDIPVIGATSILKFESKGIIETVARLCQGGYLLPAILIAVFSVVIPAAKILLCYLAVNSAGADSKYSPALRMIGKWSMADVFTASIILAYLAFGADKFTDAWLLCGFYFFLSYCGLSLISAQLASGGLKESAAKIFGKVDTNNGNDQK